MGSVDGRFPVIPGVDHLIILEEASLAGSRPSSALDAGGAKRRRVRIVMPDDRLSDMNDVLLQGAGWHVQSDHLILEAIRPVHSGAVLLGGLDEPLDLSLGQIFAAGPANCYIY
jgi:hypothetical protein